LTWKPSEWRIPKNSEVIGRGLNDKQFEVRLTKALKEIREVLVDDGLLLLWFSHRSIEAWKTVLRAIREARFKVVNIIPFVSEHPTRSITKGGVSGINRVLILVARKLEKAPEVNKESILRRFAKQVEKAKIYPHEKVEIDEVRMLTSIASLALQS